MKIENTLAVFKNKIDPLIKIFFDEKIKIYKELFPESLLLIDQVKNLTLRGGDRIRPVLFYYGFKLIKEPNEVQEQELLRLSTAFEIYHSFALIHDDIIDNGKLRRGKKTVNQFFTDRFGQTWGERLAILAGDLAEIYSQEIFRSQIFDKNESGAEIFGQMKEEMIIGEYLDSVLPLMPDWPTQEMVINILRHKSGLYSVQKPLLIGAVLAGADDEQLKSLSLLGDHLGLAFQIQDDILGIFGEQNLLGKSVISDIKEGKRTLLMVKTWERLDKAQDKKLLTGLLGKSDITKKEIAWVKQMIKDTQSLDYCNDKCKKLIEQAKRMLEKEKFAPEAKLFISDLADFIYLRKY